MQTIVERKAAVDTLLKSLDTLMAGRSYSGDAGLLVSMPVCMYVQTAQIAATDLCQMLRHRVKQMS